MIDTALQRPLTQEQKEFLHSMPDDTEEAPWMVMGDGQFHAATNLYVSLETYVRRQGLGWYVGGMLPIYYPDPQTGETKTVAPDVLVAQVPRRPRQSYDLLEEGVFPQFVVEVVSPDSRTHDDEGKRGIYALLGAQEYVLYAPHVPGAQATRLWGYRRDAAGALAPWPPDAQGRLWSAALGLWLVAQERELRAALPGGALLLTLEESEQARLEAEQRARLESDRARLEAEQRATAEAEVTRLREELQRYRAGLDDAAPGGDAS